MLHGLGTIIKVVIINFYIIRECDSTLNVGLARSAPPTNTNFRLTLLLTRLQDALYEDLPICDPFWENVPKVRKTTIEIRLKVGNNSIFNKYLKAIFS